MQATQQGLVPPDAGVKYLLQSRRGSPRAGRLLQGACDILRATGATRPSCRTWFLVLLRAESSERSPHIPAPRPGMTSARLYRQERTSPARLLQTGGTSDQTVTSGPAAAGSLRLCSRVLVGGWRSNASHREVQLQTPRLIGESSPGSAPLPAGLAPKRR